MKIDSLRQKMVSGSWDFISPNSIDDTINNIDLRSQAHICESFQPHLKVSLKDISNTYGGYHRPQAINESTYKDIANLIDGNFLNQEVRAKELSGIKMVGFKPEDTLNFHIHSSNFTENRIKYTNSVQFDQWVELGTDPDFNFTERARLLLWVGDIRLHCTCPSFLYHGYQYMCTVLDAAIYPEERFPRIKNPSEKGIVCKHMNRILKVLPFHQAEISKELRNQFG